MNSYSAIILAAGASSRMGEPKALLSYKGNSFLKHIYSIAETVFHTNILIVLGAGADRIVAAEPWLTEKYVLNNNWAEGMGTSIAFATKMVLQQRPATTGILFLTVDQPFISSSMLRSMVDASSANPGAIIASAYEDSPGIPALFPSNDYADLLALNGMQGAKSLLLKAATRVLKSDIHNAATDIDTPEQYRNIIGNR